MDSRSNSISDSDLKDMTEEDESEEYSVGRRHGSKPGIYRYGIQKSLT